MTMRRAREPSPFLEPFRYLSPDSLRTGEKTLQLSIILQRKQRKVHGARLKWYELI
jgi:hypothetical protein